MDCMGNYRAGVIQYLPTTKDEVIDMDQSIHTAINWLSRSQVEVILEDVCGTACYDDESITDLRDCLRECAEGTDEFSSCVKMAIVNTGNHTPRNYWRA